MYILLTETDKLWLRYEAEVGTKEGFSRRKKPRDVQKETEAAAGRLVWGSSPATWRVRRSGGWIPVGELAATRLGGQNFSLELSEMKAVTKVRFIAKENSFKVCFIA